jgi:hypothetical protein
MIADKSLFLVIKIGEIIFGKIIISSSSMAAVSITPSVLG